jgi:hypothetical protein
MEWMNANKLEELVEAALRGFVENMTAKGKRPIKEKNLIRLKDHLVTTLSENLSDIDDAYIEQLENEIDEIRQEYDLVSGPRAELLEEWRYAKNVIKLLLYDSGYGDEPYVTSRDQIQKFQDVDLVFDEDARGVLIDTDEPLEEKENL